MFDLIIQKLRFKLTAAIPEFYDLRRPTSVMLSPLEIHQVIAVLDFLENERRVMLTFSNDGNAEQLDRHLRLRTAELRSAEDLIIKLQARCAQLETALGEADLERAVSEVGKRGGGEPKA